MGKILSSLPNTIIAGVVLTIIMVVVAPMIAGGSHETTSAETSVDE